MNSKTIHIIWLGPKPVFDKYLPSIRKYCPKGFTIKIWRDDEVVPLCQDCEYFQRHYEKRNWAFCSDYARFKILSLYGGIYIDTDIQFLKPIDDLIEKGSFCANEKSTHRINTGLIVYFDQPHHPVAERIMNFYREEGHNWSYLADGEVLSNALKKYGYEWGDNEQHLTNGMTVYQVGTFDGDKDNPEPHARAIHWYTRFWATGENLQFAKMNEDGEKPVID